MPIDRQSKSHTYIYIYIYIYYIYILYIYIYIYILLECKSPVVIDVSFNSSKTTCRICATSCWELKSKGALRVDEILHLIAYRKLKDQQTQLIFFLIPIFNAVDFSNGDSCADSTEAVLVK